MSQLDLGDQRAYQQWADAKRAAFDQRQSDDFAPVVDIDGDGNIPPPALQIIAQQIARYNFAIYRLQGKVEDHLASLRNIGRQLGLKEMDKNLCAREDRITRLTVQDQGRANLYIPYTNKAIGWHTDGYYNPMHQRVLAMVLHCEQPAAEGGDNQLLDPDLVYIHLRDENPMYIKALTQPQVMCIPQNIEDGELIRPQTCSAVFLEEDDSALSMRFSKRKHNIIWAEDALTREALDCLFKFLESDTRYIINYRLNAGEGVINNNVLHTRSAFVDDTQHKRVYYRARYYNRINIQ
ncbi:MAG: TauD/TfdA family dioxygenase [Gammaproteobacteria bacterium]|nr:TauD/TfdA family dioxygenase [Gammaproteobacteria bacterium]